MKRYSTTRTTVQLKMKAYSNRNLIWWVDSRVDCVSVVVCRWVTPSNQRRSCLWIPLVELFNKGRQNHWVWKKMLQLPCLIRKVMNNSWCENKLCQKQQPIIRMLSVQTVDCSFSWDCFSELAQQSSILAGWILTESGDSSASTWWTCRSKQQLDSLWAVFPEAPAAASGSSERPAGAWRSVELINWELDAFLKCLGGSLGGTPLRDKKQTKKKNHWP